jgi:phenylalanyl-tRNA synthetase beta chain
MRIPLSWLRELVDVDLPVEVLADRLNAAGLEVESITRPGAGIRGVRAVRVLHHEPHPDADALRLVDVTGPEGDGVVRVVCGASNFDVGDVVLAGPELLRRGLRRRPNVPRGPLPDPLPGGCGVPNPRVLRRGGM